MNACRLAAALALGCLACQPAAKAPTPAPTPTRLPAPSAPEAPPVRAASTDDARPPPANPCVDPLRHLAHGRLDQWQGLTDACTYEAAEAAWGPGRAVQRTRPGKPPDLFIHWPATPFAPHGILATTDEGRLRQLRIEGPALDDATLARLPPATMRDGRWGPDRLDLAWPTRGLGARLQTATSPALLLVIPPHRAHAATMRWRARQEGGRGAVIDRLE